MELEVKHIATYLPHKIECSYISDDKRTKAYLTGVSRTDGIETTYKRKKNGCSGDYIGFTGENNIIDLKFKLILRPLSDLNKEVKGHKESFKLFYSDVLYKKFDYGAYASERLTTDIIHNLKFEIVQQLFEWHFDVFGLIDKGLAIDINTIKK